MPRPHSNGLVLPAEMGNEGPAYLTGTKDHVELPIGHCRHDWASTASSPVGGRSGTSWMTATPVPLPREPWIDSTLPHGKDPAPVGVGPNGTLFPTISRRSPDSGTRRTRRVGHAVYVSF